MFFKNSRNREFKDVISDSNTKIIGIAGFTTYVYDNQSIERTAKITSHILEDGSQVQDHIAFSPVVMNISGVVSNHFYQAKGQLKPNIGRSIPVKDINFLLGREQNANTELITSGINNINKAEYYQGQYNDTKKYFKSNQQLGKQENINHIQSFIDTITTCFNNKKLITIDFGYQKFDQVAIEQFSTTQSSVEDAVYFTLRFQEITFAKSETIRTGFKYSDPIKKGTQKGNIKKIPKPTTTDSKTSKKGNSSTLYNMTFGLK